MQCAVQLSEGPVVVQLAPFTVAHLAWEKFCRYGDVEPRHIPVEPGLGWVLWRDKAALPEELVFHVNYLGGERPMFTLNFSRFAAPIPLILPRQSIRSIFGSCAFTAWPPPLPDPRAGRCGQ